MSPEEPFYTLIDTSFSRMMEMNMGIIHDPKFRSVNDVWLDAKPEGMPAYVFGRKFRLK